MPGLTVVALISGGKDSLFSILHCLANGHRVVALANLHPPHTSDGVADDLESYMYQTIGHAVIPLYEQALGLPVYRQEILGDAANREKSYGPQSARDETESLLPLLRRVMAAHPEVDAVSTGAILSDYQRTRVESVALRLGLAPLSYLWQWPSLPPATATSLLEDMASAGQDARIIKVASGGLDESFLWHNVAETRTISRLSKAARRFGTIGDGAVLGEGGEYETLAVDGPPPLWKGRIVVPDDCVQIVTGEGGSASLRIARPTVIAHQPGSKPGADLRTPPLLDSRSQIIHEALLSDDAVETTTSSSSAVSPSSPDGVNADDRSHHVRLSNVVGDGADPASQTQSIMDQIQMSLAKVGHDFKDTAYTIIILRDMSDFAAVNTIYGRHFVHPNPPARLTIACADVLPPAALLSISTISVPGPRQGLHVQSRSYWAPANIGPYSQAISLPDDTTLPESIRGSVYIAGQIPLVPATMDLPPTGAADEREKFCLQSVLALQHLARIGVVMKVRRWTFGVAFLARSHAPHELPRAVREEIARRSWRDFHIPPTTGESDGAVEDEDEEFDVWNVTHGSSSRPWRTIAEDDAPATNPTVAPPLAVFEVDGLPRGAGIEWVGCGNLASGEQPIYPLHLQSILESFEGRA